MNIKKIGQILGCSVLTLLGVLILIGMVGSAVEEISAKLGPRASKDLPRAGYWSGEDVHFRISADGRISDLWIRGDALPTSCVYDWKDEQKALSGGRFTYSYRDNEVKGFYGNDKKFHGTYKLLICDNIYIYAGQPPLRGEWEASWASSQ